ncbi:DEAD/DEAH box helicase family protein [Streptomyces sp. NPDC127119]|uniref:DEAD/DEAH box helicase family protein n=1 Tax=Streptomyces sp. NPDC127119 TaxID=3345370 RepID=UPI00363B0A7D
MISLLPFQQIASTQIATRFLEYAADPVTVGTSQNRHSVPFFQALSSLTASGKTVIMADALNVIASSLTVEPVVLWLSKLNVVVEQSFANFQAGGKYHHLLGNYLIKPLAEYNAGEVRESNQPQMYFATVGTFNQKGKENSNLLIYKSGLDTTDQSIWEALKSRIDANNVRRPLLVVYDEAHNLSDQQSDLLLELQPDALLLASATMKLPVRIAREVEHLRDAGGRADNWFTTRIDANRVADSGLVKSTVLLAGYNSPMEDTIADMLSDMREAATEGDAQGLLGAPKAIYVCNINTVADDGYRIDDPRKPFSQRKAPPILIWRYLTEQCGVSPEEVAVYCTLKQDKDYPLPDEFNLFSGGDKDYESFTRGDYKHVIFNISLQEGWDDPLCYFAYVDKSMDSKVQIEQIIGRVLRQPGAQHYPAERLNTAHFYVRVDRNEAFQKVLNDVEQRLGQEAPQVKFISTPPGKPRPQEYVPSEPMSLPATGYETKDALDPMEHALAKLHDYRVPSVNTHGKGSRKVTSFDLAERRKTESEWEVLENPSLVSVRWVFNRELRQRHSSVLNVVLTDDPKFDAGIGVGSPAHTHVTEVAADVVDAYLENISLTQRKSNPYSIGPILARSDEIHLFQNSLHEGYDRLNRFELEFAQAVDQFDVPWCRNPSRIGYKIPLAVLGPTENFYPDFVIWIRNRVLLVDTKGEHLIHEAAARKLVNIRHRHDATRFLDVRFVSKGQWKPDPVQESSSGFTLWGHKGDGARKTTHYDELRKLVRALLS